MAQGQIQTQTQEQTLEQKLSIRMQKFLQSQLISLPVNELLDRVNTEMNDNPALEADIYGDNDAYEPDTSYSGDEDNDEDDFEKSKELEERRSALDEALENIGRDDEDLPVYSGGNSAAKDKEEMVYGAEISFYDRLKEQMGEYDMTEKQSAIMEYVICSLDDDGLLRKSNDAISDELAIYYNVDATDEEIEDVVGILHSFEPAGIGARDLRECLLIQIDRRERSELTTAMHRVIYKYFDDFAKKHWEKIRKSLSLTDIQSEALMRELRKLNPKPGASLGETIGRSIQQITPDFIVDTNDDGSITVSLNIGEVPELQVSLSFIETIRDYNKNPDKMNRREKEALLYSRKKVDAARIFIEAMKVRRNTLLTAMRAIVQWQHRFFEDGNEALIRPMNLRDISEKTGLSVSTISRVSNNKYAQTRWGTFPLRYFFSDGYVNDDGEELSTRAIKVALRDILAEEDKDNPYNDDRLSDLLAAKGFPVSRRTVTKYRKLLGIPSSRLRK